MFTRRMRGCFAVIWNKWHTRELKSTEVQCMAHGARRIYRNIIGYGLNGTRPLRSAHSVVPLKEKAAPLA